MNMKFSLDQKKFGTEDLLTKIVKNWLDLQLDVAYYKASDRYSKGISDIIACVNGRMVCIELKAEYYKPTPQQLDFIRAFKGVGAIAGVCYTLGEVKALVDEARKA